MVLFKEKQSSLHCKDKANPEKNHIIFLSNTPQQDDQHKEKLNPYGITAKMIYFIMSDIKEILLVNLSRENRM